MSSPAVGVLSAETSAARQPLMPNLPDVRAIMHPE